MWIEAQNTEEAIALMEKAANSSIISIGESIQNIVEELHTIRDNKTIEQLNPKVQSNLLDILKYGE